MKRLQSMRDTSSEITNKMCEMIQRKSPLERLLMGCSMYETSKQLVIRAIVENNPQISTEELRREFFLRFYGLDFTLIKQEKIIQHLMHTSQAKF